MATQAIESDGKPYLEEHLEIPHEETIFGISYGKVMMWYFLISDTFTFAAFLIAYALTRFRNTAPVEGVHGGWPMASEVFQSVPGLADHGWPLVFVSIMTFILILSSVTMVRAVQEGFMMNKWGVVRWLIPTILGGFAFLYCQYLEWTHLAHEGMWFGKQVLGPDGAVLGKSNPFSALGHANETGIAGPQAFAYFFFTITGFHGMHVALGVGLNIWLLVQTVKGTFEKRQSYEMVEKIGLFWHFVDLVWVFVFLAYYLL